MEHRGCDFQEVIKPSVVQHIYRSSDDPLRTVVSRYEQIQGLWALPLISPHGDANFSADLKRKGCSRFSKKEMDCFVVHGVLNS